MKNNLSGTFQITGWGEDVYSEEESNPQVQLTKVKVTQDYTGGIDGHSEIEFLMSYQQVADEEKSAIFVGLEKVMATIDEKTGSFILQHNGTFSQGVASSDFIVVKGSGQGELVGISGSGSFNSTENGQADYQLNID